MLVVAGVINLDPAKRAAATAAFDKMREATLKESGCVAYQAYFDRTDGGTLFLFEKWESEDALTAHMGTPHMAEFGGAMGDFGVKGADVIKYTVSEEKKIM